MKKFYTLLLAAAATLGASAAPTLVANGVATDAYLQDLTNTQAVEATANGPMKAAPGGTYNVVGTGYVSEGILCDLVDGIESGIVWEITIERSASNPFWYRTQLYNENSPILDITGEPDAAYFYFNTANKNKVYSDAFVIAEIFQVYQANKESGLTENLANPQYVTENPAYGKLENNVITFPAESFWVLNEAERRFMRCDQMATFAIALPGATLEPAWIDLGTTTFVDGIIAAGFTWTDTNTSHTVESTVGVFENRYMPNMVKVSDAWLEWFGDMGGTKPMYIDIANPECIVLPQQATGIVTEDDGEWYILSRSANVATPGTWDYTTPDNAPYNIAMNAERLITFPGNSVFMYWPEKDPDHLYTWKNPLEGSIQLPESTGVNNIALDNENAPVEYFNLNGIRVANPANGIYIMRQGNKVNKVFVR